MSEKNTISQRITLDGADEVKRILSSIGDAADKAFERARNAANKFKPNLGDNIAASVNGFAGKMSLVEAAYGRVEKANINLQTRFAEFERAIGSVALRLGALQAAAVAAAGGILELAKSQTEAEVNASNQAQALGLTVQQYSGLSSAAGESGVAQEQFASALNHLNKAIAETGQAAAKGGTELVQFGDKTVAVVNGSANLAKGGTGAASALEKLGIAAKDGNGNLRSTNDVLLDIADKFAKMPDGAKKSALALELLGGKTGSELIPFLNRGSAGIREFIEDITKMGLMLTDQQVGIARFSEEGLSRLGLAFQGLKKLIGDAFEPLIGIAGNVLATLFENNFDIIKAAVIAVKNEVASLAFDLAKLWFGFDSDVENRWLLSIRDAFLAIKYAATLFFLVALEAFIALWHAADTAAGAINRIFGTQFTAGTLLAIAAVVRFTGVLGVLVSTFNLGAAIFNSVAAVFNGLRLAASFLAPAIETVITAFAGLVTGVAAFIGIPAEVVVAIIAAVAAAAVAIYVYWDKIKAGAASAWAFVKQEAGSAWAEVKALWAPVPGFFSNIFSGVRSTFTGWADEARAAAQIVSDALVAAYDDPKKVADAFFEVIRNAWNTLWSDIKSLASAGMDGVVSVVESAANRIVSLIESAASAIRNLTSSGSAADSSGGGDFAPAFSSGGFVSGPGTATSDSIRAWLSNGEFVMRTAAVRKLGVSFLAALNSGRFSLDQLLSASRARFSLGGLVRGSDGIPGFASGGLVTAARGASGGGTPLILNFGDKSFAATTEAHVAAHLASYLRDRKGLSLGRRPA
ncbi:MAG: phage tail tape measure protein [Alphaproteobacteria bacterium]|nr:phage tail tape measure protein [Alphaproteobacteria bacterium]